MATGTEQLMDSSSTIHASSFILGIPYSSSAQVTSSTQALIPTKTYELEEKRFTAIIIFAVFSSLLVLAFILSRVKVALTRPRGAKRKQHTKSRVDFANEKKSHQPRSSEKKQNLQGSRETVNPQVGSCVRVKPSPKPLCFAAVNEGFEIELKEQITTSESKDGPCEGCSEPMDRVSRIDKILTQGQAINEGFDVVNKELFCNCNDGEDILLVGPVIYV